MNKTANKLITTSALLLTGMQAFNYYIDSRITPVRSSRNDKIYSWKEININYSEKGSEKNPPLLLIHNLHPTSSKEEWYLIDERLAKKFHIYELDLPGCGKSDKPNITYINYMYVQLLSDFIDHVIGKKTNICAASFSSSFTLMAARFHPDLIDKIIVINPTAIDTLYAPVTKKGKLTETVLSLPIIGTFIYNCITSRSCIIDDNKLIYFYNEKNVPSKAIDISYYNAHYKHSNGKYLYGSIIANYTNINIIHALPKIENDIYLIGNRNCKTICQEYKKYNHSIHTIYVSHCRMLPQLEIPETMTEKICDILNN